MAQIFRKLILIFGDLLCIQTATFIAIYMQSDSMRSMQIDFHIRLTVLLSVFLIFFFNIYGLFSLIRKRLSEIFLNLIVAVGNIFIAAMAVTFFLRDFEYSRMVIIYSAVFGFMLLALWQYVMHQIEVKHLPIPTVFVAADSEEQEKLKTKIRKTYGLEKSTLKFISTDNESDTIKQIKASDIVLIGESLPVEEKEHIFHITNEKKKMVILVPTLYEISCSKMYLWQIDDLPTQKSIAHAINIGTAHLKAHAGYCGFGNSINFTIAGNACNGGNSKIRQPGANNLQPGKGRAFWQRI